MTKERAAGFVFAALAAATIGAFFLAQRVKSTPATLARSSVLPWCSPNSDSRFDGCRAAFLLRKDERVTVSVVDDKGELVDELVRNQPLGRYDGFRVLWKGRTSDGERAPDGQYRFRLTLGRQGRSILLPRPFDLDITPPRPVVHDIQPGLLPAPGGGAAQIDVRPHTRHNPTRVRVFRTWPSPSDEPVADLGTLKGPGRVSWDGTRNGVRVRPGTYVVALETRDRAGNIGRTPLTLPPRPPYGAGLPGRGGISVRYLAVQPPLGEPAVGGEDTIFYVDARGAAYHWALRRAGEARPRKESDATRAKLRMKTPDGESGLFILDVRTRRHATSVPLAVQGLKRHRILVVLPSLLWQGLNQVDDDGDGLPDTLDRGRPVRRDRVLADGLPPDLAKRVAPLLIFLDRQRLRYDLTTDLALAAKVGPPIEGHAGVVLAGDERWLPLSTQRTLDAYVRAGGRVATFGVDSLRRSVRVTPTQLLDPTTASPTDTFGFALGRPLRKPATATVETDKIDLFKGDVLGGTGIFRAHTNMEPVTGLPRGAKLLARATTPAGAAPIVAASVGRGLVVHVGLPDLPGRLSRGGNEAALVKRTWELLGE
jgi:hypothetical protein